MSSSNIDFITQRSNRKSFQLSAQKGYFLLKAPLHATDAQINDFIFKNQHWIAQHKHLCEEKPFTFLGLQNWSFTPTEHPLLSYDLDQKVIYFPQSLLHTHKKTFIIRLYSQYLIQWLPTQNAIALAHNIEPPNSWSVKHLSDAWGRCNSNRVINIDPCVAALPVDLQCYIACHEMAHLVHLNHSQAFWALCDRLYPKTRRADKSLSQYCKSNFF